MSDFGGEEYCVYAPGHILGIRAAAAAAVVVEVVVVVVVVVVVLVRHHSLCLYHVQTLIHV